MSFVASRLPTVTTSLRSVLTSRTSSTLAPSTRSFSRQATPRSFARASLPSTPHPLRTYSTSPQSSGGPSEKTKDRFAIGPFNATSATLFVVTGVGLYFYFRSEKAAVEQRRAADTAAAKVGRPRIGGNFKLVMPDTDGKSGRFFTDEDMKGAFSLVYFGFTNCPDICPEELDKMGEVVERVDGIHGQIINPIFVTCDPARDTLPAVATYVSEFHPRMVGLTGSYEAVKEACKAYRVYFSTPPGAKADEDYLVDHSIFFYLMDPEGKFVDAFGRSVDGKATGDKVLGFIEQWKRVGNPIGKADVKERLLKDESRKVDSVV